jgi:hypothetical protein
MTLNTVLLKLIKNNCPFPNGVSNMVCRYIPPVSIDITIDDIDIPDILSLIHVEELKIYINDISKTFELLITIIKELSPFNLLKVFHIHTNFVEFNYYDLSTLFDILINECKIEKLMFPQSNISIRLILKCVSNIPTLKHIDVNFISDNDTPADHDYLASISWSKNCLIYENSIDTVFSSTAMNFHVDILYDIYMKINNHQMTYFTAPESYNMMNLFRDICIDAPSNIELSQYDNKLRDIPISNVYKFIQLIYNNYKKHDFGVKYLEREVDESNQQYLNTFIHSIIGRVCL